MIDTQAYLRDQRHPMIDVSKWQKTVNLMADLFNAPCGSIVQHVGDIFRVICTAETKDNFQSVDTTFPWEINSYCRRIIETREPLYVKQGDQDDEWKDTLPVTGAHIYSYFGYPIFWPDGTVFGTICVSELEGTDYSETMKNVLEQFRDLVNADLALAYKYDEVESLSLTDEMTGSYNRRGLHTLGEQKIGLADRFHCGLATIFLDIDNLKQVNDQHGHAFGDKAIKLLASVIHQNIRTTDLAARVGGDEFVVLLLLNETHFIDRLPSRITDHYLEETKKVQELNSINLSIGYKAWEEKDMPDIHTMLHDSDLLMYQNKKSRKAS